jgi:hypothetical protein
MPEAERGWKRVFSNPRNLGHFAEHFAGPGEIEAATRRGILDRGEHEMSPLILLFSVENSSSKE